MKAGILTLHEADNYGAVLQAYALQTALMHLGVESECIAFESKKAPEERTPANLGKVGPLSKQLREKGAVRKELFDSFRKAYLRCSVPLAKASADELNDQYDLFIAGSDQIWNFSIPEVDGRYFLPFAAPDKRFSYAASFGGDSVPDKVKDWCIQQLSGFRAISVREKEGQETVKTLTGRDSTLCVDPVFLLEKEEWRKLTHKIDREPYILLHMVQYDKQTVDLARKMAEERGLGLQMVTASFMYACGFEPWCSIGVEEWLSLINGAECVITDSFHGVAFSMIFGRSFLFSGLKDNLKRRNVRVEELLGIAGIERYDEGEIRHISEQEFVSCMGDLKKQSYDYLEKIVRY